MIVNYQISRTSLNAPNTWTADQTLNDNVKLLFGTLGADGELYSDGTDMFFNQLSSGGIMVGLGASPPSPDGVAVHIWLGDAGGVVANANAGLILEKSDTNYLQFLTANLHVSGLLFGSPASNVRGRFQYHGSADTPSDTFSWSTAGAERLRYSAGAFAFQEETTISAAGDLVLNPTGNVAIISDVEIGSGDAFHYGVPTTNSTWKTTRDGTKLSFLRRESGVYIEKGFFDASFHTSQLILEGAADGIFTGLVITNSQAAATDSLNETAEIKFGFGSNTDVARITVDKLKDYTSVGEEDSRIGFWVDSGGTLTQIAHFMPDGLMLLLGDSRIRFAGTAGGGGQSIQYKDSAGSNRAALLFPGSDVVSLVNRAANGVVKIGANTSTGGNPGEVIVAEFQDDQITFLASGGNIGIGGTPLVGFHATGLVTGADDFNNIVAVFQGATGGSQNGYLLTSDDVASDVWLAFRGVPADTNQWLMGARFFSGDTFAIGYGDKNSTMTFPLDTGAKFVITTGGLVGIGTTTPATSALLELNSTTGALLVPRMTTTQRNALTVSDGMIIYNVTTATMQGRINNAWVNM